MLEEEEAFAEPPQGIDSLQLDSDEIAQSVFRSLSEAADVLTSYNERMARDNRSYVGNKDDAINLEKKCLQGKNGLTG